MTQVLLLCQVGCGPGGIPFEGKPGFREGALITHVSDEVNGLQSQAQSEDVMKDHLLVQQ